MFKEQRFTWEGTNTILREVSTDKNDRLSVHLAHFSSSVPTRTLLLYERILDVQIIDTHLQKAGQLPCAPMYGRMDQISRERAVRAFNKGYVAILRDKNVA